jgi:hypothetical protein
MDISDENFRFYVFVEAKRGVAPKEVLEHLQDAFGDAAPSQSFTYKWHKNFTSGERNSVETLPRCGRPISQRTDANISRVFDYVEEYPKSTVSCIAGSLQLSKATVQRILVDELLFRKICSVWVRHKLSPENKQQRIACAQDFLELFECYSEYELLRLWATQDERWIPFELTGTKENNKVWIAPQTSRPHVVRPQMTFR